MKVNNKFLNIESKSKKSQIEKEIHEFEDEKSKKIMQLGLSAYDKIRRGNIDESLFGELIYEIKKIDLEIYNRMLDIADMEGLSIHMPSEESLLPPPAPRYTQSCHVRTDAPGPALCLPA